MSRRQLLKVDVSADSLAGRVIGYRPPQAFAQRLDRVLRI